MAVARAQGPGGFSAIHVWLIVFVALWLTSTVLLVVLYLDQEQMTRQITEYQETARKAVSSAGKSLPQWSSARPGEGSSMVDLVETARANTAEIAVGDPNADVAGIRNGLEDLVARIRDNPYVQEDGGFAATNYREALDNMFGLYRTAASAREQAEQGVDELSQELEQVRTAQTQQKEAFDQQASELRDRLSKISAEYADARSTREAQIGDFEGQIQQVKDQCSEDIQAQRAETAECRDDFSELLARYQQLQDKLGESQVSPLPMATARQPDGVVKEAKPGDAVVYINLGRRDHLTLGLQFAVYDALEGIPADGRAKARIQVVSIFEQSAECSILEMLSNDLIMAGDLIANPIYDPDRTLKFYVLGQFDLDGDGEPDRDGKARIENLIQEWGGKVEPNLTAQLDFVVLGGPPPAPRRAMDRDIEDDLQYQAAKRAMDEYTERVATAEALAIPRLTQSVLFSFLGYRPTATSIALP